MLSRIRSGLAKRIARRRYAPDIEVVRTPGLLRLGSSYGGWMFEPSGDLQHSTILSCGLGEDASFDVEFATRFQARVIIVDPTPRAVLHFAQMMSCVGQPATAEYAKGGKQPVTAYNLRAITANQLVHEPFALWVENTRLKFYAPKNPSHVSHSIVNHQNEYAQDGAYIEVEAVTPESLVDKYHLQRIALIKLDIEGAEIDVIKHALGHSILPRQVLVEFDEMNFPSARSKANAENTDGLLRQAGYRCHYYDGMANFLYVLD
jgi:FkbM family methyltransferase